MSEKHHEQKRLDKEREEKRIAEHKRKLQLQADAKKTAVDTYIREHAKFQSGPFKTDWTFEKLENEVLGTKPGDEKPRKFEEKNL